MLIFFLQNAKQAESIDTNGQVNNMWEEGRGETTHIDLFQYQYVISISDSIQTEDALMHRHTAVNPHYSFLSGKRPST